LPDGVRHLVRDGDRTGKTQVGPQEKRHETV
jgi:hypothetical protein